MADKLKTRFDISIGFNNTTTPSQLQEVTLDPDATNFSYVQQKEKIVKNTSISLPKPTNTSVSSSMMNNINSETGSLKSLNSFDSTSDVDTDMIRDPDYAGMRSPGAPFNGGRSVKEIDEQLTTLRKENFNLKLRIYFLEERMGANFNADKEDAIKKNIELMVELENVRKELEDKQELLCQAARAMEIEEDEKRREINRKDREIFDLKNKFEHENRLKAKRYSQDGVKLNLFTSDSLNVDLDKSGTSEIIKKLQETIEELEEELRRERERADHLECAADITESNRSKFKNYENQIEEKNYKLDTLSYELEKSNNQIAICNLKVSTLEEDLKEKSSQLQEMVLELKGKDEDLREREIQLQEFSKMLDEVHLQIEKKDKKTEKYKSLLAQCETKNEEMKIYIDDLKTKIHNLEVRLEAALDEVKKNTNKSEFVLSTEQSVKSSNNDVELFSVSNSMPLSETPSQSTPSKNPLKQSKSSKSLHSNSTSQFISLEKSKSLNNRSSECLTQRSEPTSKSSSMSEIHNSSLSNEELLELRRNHYKACKIIKTMIQKKNEYVEQIDKLENLVGEKSGEIETLKAQVAQLSSVTSPRKKTIQEKVCEMNITASSNPAANKEKSMDEEKMQLAEQYKELADELEKKIELLNATLQEKDNQVSRLKVDLESKSNQLIDLEFEIIALNQGVGRSFNTTSEHETTMDKLYRENVEKDQVIEKLEIELRKRTCDLQGIVNNELWEKNRSIEKMQVALKSKDEELNDSKAESHTKDFQLRILKDKINELGVHVNFPPNLIFSDAGEQELSTKDTDKLQEHLKVCLQERKQLIAQVDELKTKLQSIPEHDSHDQLEKYDSLRKNLETSEKLRLEHQELCIILSTRLEELCYFLSHLLKQKAVLGFLGSEQTRKLQSVLGKSINLSQTLSTSISINPDQSLLQLTNITNLLDSTRNDSWNFDEFFVPDEDNNSYLSIVPSDVTLTYQNHLNMISAGNNNEQLEIIKVLRNQVTNLKREIELRDVELEKKVKNDAIVENDEQFVNLLVDMRSKLGEACKSSILIGEKSANTSTTLKNKNLESESESWSEPDRNVSLARIGLNDESLRKSSTSSKRNRLNKDFSTESTEDEASELNRTPSKKGSLAESRQTIISLHEQVCDLEIKLKDKENQLLAAQVAYYETDNLFKQEQVKFQETKNENAQLTQQLSYLELKMDETMKEKSNFEEKINEMELEHKNLMTQIEEKNKKLEDAEKKKRVAEDKIMDLQRVIGALEDFRKNVEATMEMKDKELNNVINRIEVEKSKAISDAENNAKQLEKANAAMLQAELQLQEMHHREEQLRDELEVHYRENLKRMEKEYEIKANKCKDAVKQIKNFYEKEYVKKSEVDRRTLEVDNICKEVDKLKFTLQESETKILGMENKEIELKTKLQDLQKEHQNKIYELQKELDDSTLHYSESILEKTKLKSENIALEQKLQLICSKENDSIAKVNNLKKELQEVQSSLQVQISQLEHQKDLLELKIKNLDAANGDLQSANSELHNRLVKLQISKNGGDDIVSSVYPTISGNKSFHELHYARQFSDHSGYASEDIPTSETGTKGLLQAFMSFQGIPNASNQGEADHERVHSNSSPDLGIESDHGRFSSLEANTNVSRPLLPTLQLTESMSNLLDPVQDLSCTNDGCCKKTKEIANENVELRKRLLRTRRALEETLNRLTLANKQKKEVEKSICKQIHKTSQVLRKAKANLDSGSETDLVKN